MNKETDDILQEFVAEGGDLRDWKGVYSIAPTQSAPIVREWAGSDGEVHREATLARWDWEKPPSMPQSRPLINARIEKLAAGSWVGPFSTSRCIVPMLGYYEWTGTKTPKTPHFLHGDDLLAAAGLTWHVNVDGERTRCFVVVTREARDASGEVHDRMPAFLTRDLWDEWLNPVSLTVKGDTGASRANREALLAELVSSSDIVAGTVREHIVDQRVNNSRTADPHDPGLIEPVSG